MNSDHNGGGLANILSNRPFIVGALFLGAYFVPFLILIGAVLAYYFRGQPEEEWVESHFQYLIRTFWILVLVPIGLTLVAAGILLGAETFGSRTAGNDATFALVITLVGSGMVMLIFSGVRTILSLMKSASHTPISNPKSWLI